MGGEVKRLRGEARKEPYFSQNSVFDIKIFKISEMDGLNRRIFEQERL